MTACCATRSRASSANDAIDPLIVIRWKDIYEALEKALDACETAAHVITNIMVKDA